MPFADLRYVRLEAWIYMWKLRKLWEHRFLSDMFANTFVHKSSSSTTTTFPASIQLELLKVEMIPTFVGFVGNIPPSMAFPFAP